MNEPQMTKREKRQQRRDEKLEKQAQAAKQQKRKSHITWGVALIVIAGIIGLAVSSGGNNPVAPITNPVFVQDDDHIKGAGTVSLIEYSDFECPACASYYPIVKQLQAAFPDELQVVYRNFPLSQIHPHADEAARAAEAAGIQGKFWEMHDKLFENQHNWPRVSDPTKEFELFAEEIGLDVEQFKTDLNGDFAKGRVSRDRASANKLRIQGTPTFFLQGKQIQSPATFEAFRALIQSVLDSTPDVVTSGAEEALPTLEDLVDEHGLDLNEMMISNEEVLEEPTEEPGDETSVDTSEPVQDL